MKAFVAVVMATVVISLVSSAQDRGGGRGPGRDPGRGSPNPTPTPNTVTNPTNYQDFAGAIGPGDFCTTCAFENRADVPATGKRSAPDRYLVNNDHDSIDARCRELGFEYGQALEWFSYQEWCRYGNAKTRTFDRYSRRWTFGSCKDGNVKTARCFRR